MALDIIGKSIQVTPACGCSLTAATIQGLTPEEFEKLSHSEPNIAKSIIAAEIREALGVRTSAFASLIEGKIEDVKDTLGTEKIGTQSIILPYIQMPQEHVMNVELFQVKAGGANAGAGSGGVHAGRWDLTIELPKGKFRTALTDIDQYFKPGMTLMVHNWGSDQTAQRVQFKIISSTNADSGGETLATVVVEPQKSSTAFAALTSDQKKLYQPEAGIVQLLHNSVSDYESWCETLPVPMRKDIRVFWLQTLRESYCTDEIYEETLKKIFSGELNDFDRAFRYMPVAQQNKLREALNQQARVNTYFFGQPINEHQTPETYKNLPKITELEDGDCILGYKAQAKGIYHMLIEEARAVDFMGENLNLNTVIDMCYDVYRTRKSAGDSISVIDLFTDRETAARIFYAFKKAFERDYSWAININMELGKTVQYGHLSELKYNLYQIPNHSFKIAVFSVDEMDDWVNEFSTTDFAAAGRMLFALDWSDIKKGVVATNRVTRKNPNPEVQAEYKCVMKANVKTYDLRSETFTMLLKNPGRHALWHNFGDGEMTLSLLPYSV